MASAHKHETNPIPSNYHDVVSSNVTQIVPWNTPGLRVIRLRLLSDPGLPFWEVSYCQGRLPSGEFVDVYLPFDALPKKGLRRAIVQHAIKDKVYAKGLGILENISTLI